ncbi:MAG: amidohydrolase family protein [Bacteroidota bacterium]|jgi:aminocarboxymuconate-semialdehyde decarboxylase|nr:amidohydrolase [Sphingobacteriales bacterium]
MHKIDIHAHILPEQIPNLKEKYGYGDDFIYLDHYEPGKANMMKADGTFFRAIDSLCWDPEAIIRHMDKQEVQLMALSTIPVLFYYWAKPEHTHEWSKYINNHLAEVQSNNPKRFVGIGTLPMQDIKLAVEELTRCKHELNLPGVEIATNILGKNLDDESFLPFYEAAEKLGMCIFVHPWDMMGQDKMKKYWLPWLVGMPAESSRAICSMIFGGIFDKFPKLRIMFAHGGGCFPHTIGRISHGYHARPDLCNINDVDDPRSYVKKFFIDSLVHDEEAFLYNLKLFGADRIALGSDFPFPLGDLEHGKFIEMMKQLDEATKEQILNKTAREWLGI